ncbi:rhodanese-like domain-containing protein [Microcoleus sp. F4-D5]|uniref:rhodanese-like domain-containing protein n=1 Tax=Microcoleus sp. F4-D5 TaxID=2818760 RepID=UPI002FD497CE
MLDKNAKPGINRYSRLLLAIMGFGLTSVASVGAVALFHHMDILTFIASLNTKQITVAQLQQGELKPVILIDVRSPEEYAEDRIGESPLVPIIDIEMGFGVKQIQSIVKSRVKSDDRPQPVIVLYCARGGRSVKAYKQLEKVARYSQESVGNETNKIKDITLNVVVLSGGIKAWRQAVPAPKDAQILAPITLGSLIKSPSVTLLSE